MSSTPTSQVNKCLIIIESLKRWNAYLPLQRIRVSSEVDSADPASNSGVRQGARSGSQYTDLYGRRLCECSGRLAKWKPRIQNEDPPRLQLSWPHRKSY